MQFGGDKGTEVSSATGFESFGLRGKNKIGIVNIKKYIGLSGILGWMRKINHKLSLKSKLIFNQVLWIFKNLLINVTLFYLSCLMHHILFLLVYPLIKW